MRSIETRTCCGTWPVRAVENNAIRILICEFTRLRVMHHPFETDVMGTFKRVPSRISSLPRRRTVSPSLSGPTISPQISFCRSFAQQSLRLAQLLHGPDTSMPARRRKSLSLDFRYGAPWAMLYLDAFPLSDRCCSSLLPARLHSLPGTSRFSGPSFPSLFDLRYEKET